MAESTYTHTPTKGSNYPPAELCRRNGWGIGTRLIGDEGYSTDVIEITAVGRHNIFAVIVSRNGSRCNSLESSWTLDCRDWREEARR